MRLWRRGRRSEPRRRGELRNLERGASRRDASRQSVKAARTTSTSRYDGHSGASVNAASCGGAALVLAAAAVNAPVLATVRASALAAAATAGHAGASTGSSATPIDVNENVIPSIHQ